MKCSAPGVPPSGARVNGRVSSFMKPRSPSKIGGEHGGSDQVAAAATCHLADRQHRREVVARMRRFERQVSVIVIEIANQKAVDERRPLDATLAAAEKARSLRRLHAQGAASSDGE